MDRILQLHVEHHSSSSLNHCESDPGGVARLGKGGGDATRAVVAFAAIMASLALLLLPSSFSSVVTARTALFVLSNAILLLLAADCRWFFSAAVVDACCEPAGDVLEKQQGRRHHQEACVPYSAGCLEYENSGGTASEASTEPAMAISNITTPLEALEEEENAPAAASWPELLRRLDGGDSGVVETTAVVDEQEPSCETGQGLDALGIDELNRRFDEFIQSRRNRWIKEEAAYLQCDFQP